MGITKRLATAPRGAVSGITLEFLVVVAAQACAVDPDWLQRKMTADQDHVARIPRHQVVAAAGAGYFVTLDGPASVVRTIDSFRGVRRAQ